MTVRLLTFDLDHTLWDPTDALIAAERAMFDWIRTHSPVTADFYPPEKFHAYKKDLAAAYPDMTGRVSEFRYELLRRIFLQSGHNSEQARSMAKAAFDAFYQARSTGLDLFPDVADVMTELRKQYQVIAISNGNADLSIAGHSHLFDHHLKADDYDAKPAPDMFHAALEIAGVSAGQTVHIGDHPEQDVAAAQELGIKGIWFNDKKVDWPLSDVTPNAEFSHWSQLVLTISALADTSS
ncbi:HAD family hydrolase [Thalassolituus sp.]|uniref:HAD family hydrolase n=1 Tax=Thalassolituus sp. TaxID=2030822 RepID=UPI003515C8FE